YFVISVSRLHRFVGIECPEGCAWGADPRDFLMGAWPFEKHLLSFFVVRAAVKAATLLGVQPIQALVVFLALVSATLASSIFLLFVRLGTGMILALTATAWLLSANSIFFQISVIESYAFTMTTMVLALLVFLELERHLSRRPVWMALFAGLSGGLVALSN